MATGSAHRGKALQIVEQETSWCMSPEPSGKRTGEVAETIERIMQSTVDTVARRGAEGATLKDIATGAGVSKALLHYHFKSKEELLIESLKYLSKDIAGEILDDLKAKSPSVELALEAARDLYSRLIRNEIRVRFLTQVYGTAIHNDRLRKGVQNYLALEGELILNLIRVSLGPQ